MPKPVDRVQLIKRESDTAGGDSADSDDFYLESPLDPSEDAPEVRGLFIQDTVGGNDEEVYLTRDGDDMIFRDAAVAAEVSLSQIMTAASGFGLSESQHKALRDVVHFIDGPGDGFSSGAFREVLPAGSFFPTSVVWYEAPDKTQKIIEQTISYNSGKVTPTPFVWKMYGEDGSTVLVEVSDSVSYEGVVEHTRNRTITVY